MNRKQLLAGSLGAAAAAGCGTVVRAATDDLSPRIISRNTSTLVLPGGGARGAFEAGAIEGIRQRAGIGDGVPLPGLDAVCGTSIGAINGWFVATAQYSLLARLWDSISDESIFRIKKRYEAVVTPSSGVLTRIVQAALISVGLTSNVTGLLDGRRVHDWLVRHIDPTVPVVLTFVFTATNLDEQRSEIFFRSPVEATPAARATAAQNLRDVFGKSIVARELRDGDLVPALAGSSAIPILLDPVTIDLPDGPQTYIDGGVADSAPIDVARAVSRRLQVVFVDPARVDPVHFPNAAAIGTAAFGIAQNRVLESSLRAAYIETRGKRLFRGASLTPEQRDFLRQTFDVDIELIRPARELPVEVAGFDDGNGIRKAYELGRQAGLAGFEPYDPGVALTRVS